MKKLCLAVLLAMFAAIAGQSQNPATGTITASSTACATANSCVTLMTGTSTGAVFVGIKGSSGSTFQFEVFDGLQWSAANATPPSSTSSVTSATADGTWRITAAGPVAVRVRCSTYGSGTIQVQLTPAAVSAGGGGGGSLSTFPGVPSGACSANQAAVNTATGDFYSCNNTVWLLVGPGAAGSAAFSTITAGTNAGQALVVGNGSTLATTGTGAITASSAAKWTTARNLAGNSTDGSAAVPFANKFIVQGTTDTGLSGPQFLGALSTGIVKNTTTTGVLSIAVAGDFPTLNQSTTGAAWSGTFTAAANKVLGGATPSAVTITSTYVDNSIALTGTDINTSNQVTATHLSSGLPINQGGTGATTQQAAFDALAPTSTVAGTINYWNGTHWVKIDGNASGTQWLQETSSGVPSWTTPGGAGTVTTSGSPASSYCAFFSGATAITGTANCTLDSSGNATLAGTLTVGTAASTAAIGLDTTGGNNSLTTQASANGLTWTLPSTTGTFADSATLPIVLSATTGVLTCPTCIVATVNPSAGVLHVAGSTQTATGSAVALTDMATQAANTIVGNVTSGSAAPTAAAAPAGGTSGCSGSSDTVIYTAGTGWGCHQISGSGTVNSGTASHLAYYASTTTAVSDMGADYTFATHTLTGASTAILDLSAGSATAGFKAPTVAGAVPTADGFQAFNSTTHTHVWGSNGTTLVGAAAATGTGTATTCSNQFVSAVSGIAVPTCTTATLASAQFANQGTTTTVLHGNGAGNPAFGAVVGADMTNNTVTATQLAAQYSKGSCTEVWGGSGTSFAMASGDDAISNNSCYNDSGVTRTITAVKCRSDNAANTTVLTPTFGAAGTGTAILTGTVTCGNSYAYSATGTLNNTAWTTGTGIDPGMSTVGNATSIAMIVEYTF